MTNAQNQITPHAEKFHSGEQLWFWFLYSKSLQNGFNTPRGHTTRRVCELLDVEIMITRLYLGGKLTDEQLHVMKEFGDRRRAPHQYIWSENRAAALWTRAMETIESDARARGWID